MVEEEEGTTPLFCSIALTVAEMITVERIRQSVLQHLEGTAHFLVAVELRPGNKAVVEVDNDRAITLQELADLNRAVRDELGEEADDHELQFSSPGMGRPFKVQRQYEKHLGRIVDVQLADGRTLNGELSAFDGTTLGLRLRHPSKVKGRLPKLDAEVTPIPFAEIKATSSTIPFK